MNHHKGLGGLHGRGGQQRRLTGRGGCVLICWILMTLLVESIWRVEHILKGRRGRRLADRRPILSQGQQVPKNKR